MKQEGLNMHEDESRVMYRVIALSTLFLFSVVILLPTVSAALVPGAQSTGYHDTLYVNEIAIANTTVSQLNLLNQVLFSGSTLFDGNVRFDSNSVNFWGTGVTSINGNFRVLDGSYQPRFIASATGVGIGTGSPTERLHVVGNILTTGDVTAENGDFTSLTATTGNFNSIISSSRITAPEFCIGGDCQTSWPSGGGTLDGTESPSQVAFFTTSNQLSSNSNLIFNGNSLGIGINPLSTLHVNGNIKVEDSLIADGNIITQGSLGVGTDSPSSEVEIIGDAYFSAPQSGFILKDASDNCHEVTITTGGSFSINGITCPDAGAVSPPQNVAVESISIGAGVGGAFAMPRSPNVEVEITWDAPADMTGIIEFAIHRDGTEIDRVDDAVRSYTHESAFVDSEYTYSVRALTNVDSSTQTTTSYTPKYGVVAVGMVELYCQTERASAIECEQPTIWTGSGNSLLLNNLATMEQFCSRQTGSAGHTVRSTTPSSGVYEYTGSTWSQVGGSSTAVNVVDCV